MVYIFGGDAKIITNNSYIVGVSENEDFDYETTGEIFHSKVIKDIPLERKIKITNAIVQFYDEDAYNRREIYWTDKTLRLLVWSNTSRPLLPNLTHKDFDISGGSHNVPYITVAINKTIEANKNFSIVILCSKNYSSRKPDDVVLTDVTAPHLTPQSNYLPFKQTTVKVNYI